MPPKNVEDLYPLTPMQRLMLLHALTHSAPVALTNQVTFEIAGPLDPTLFRAAWAYLVARHTALRTAFLWDGLEQALSVVRSVVDLPLTEIDLSDRPEEERRQELDALTQKDRSTAYDLTRAPLMRCTLVRLAPERHVFIWSIHHLVVDRWSYGVLVEELQTVYDALAADSPVRLQVPGQFRDYVEWLTRRDEREGERFWRQELDGLKRPTPWVPGYAGRPANSRTTTSHHPPVGLLDRIEARANVWQTTPATLLLAATGLFLARRARSLDPVLGVTVSGRPTGLPRIEGTVGTFVNNVPLRMSLRPEQPVQVWLRNVQISQVRRQEHEHVSLADLHDWSGLAPSEPLFDGLVVLNLRPSRPPLWRDVVFTPVTATLDARYPWVLGISVEDDDFTMKLVHDADYLDAADLLQELVATIEDLLGVRSDAVVGALLQVPDPHTTPSWVVAGQVAPDAEGSEPRPDNDPMLDVEKTLAEQLLGIWRDVLSRPSIELDDDFFVLGGTSLQAAQIFIRVERLTGRVLPVSTLIGSASVRRLLVALDQPLESALKLVSLRLDGSRRPLVAVPGIGGEPIGLHRFARVLKPDRPFYALRSRGLDGRDDPLTSIEEIADDFVSEVVPLSEGGVHLMGVCWGAAVAFELAGRLQARGCTVLSLSLLDPPPLQRADAAAAGDVRRDFLRDRFAAYWSDFRARDWQSRRQMIVDKTKWAARLVRSGGASHSSAVELNALRVRAANTAAVERYRPEPLGTAAKVYLTDRWHGEGRDPRLEWCDLIDPLATVVTIPGRDTGDVIANHSQRLAQELDTFVNLSEGTVP